MSSVREIYTQRMHHDSDRSVRWALRLSIVLLALGAVLFVIGLARPALLVVYVSGIAGLVGGLLVWALVLLEGCWRALTGLPRRNYSVLSPLSYTCSCCGYKLRGVRGPFCPECGTVRPMPVDGDDVSD